MRLSFTTLIRCFLVAAFTVLATLVALWLTSGLKPLAQSLILGGLAITFAISEAYFGRLLTELNAVLRSTGFSVFQAEKLRQIIIPAKKRLWTLWWTSAALKIVAFSCAGALFKLDEATTAYQCALYIGYASVCLTIPISIWAFRNFKIIEKKRDNLAMEETKIKEQKRLNSDLHSGKPHDFEKDDIAKSYGRPSMPI